SDLHYLAQTRQMIECGILEMPHFSYHVKFKPRKLSLHGAGAKPAQSDGVNHEKFRIDPPSLDARHHRFNGSWLHLFLATWSCDARLYYLGRSSRWLQA